MAKLPTVTDLPELGTRPAPYEPPARIGFSGYAVPTGSEAPGQALTRFGVGMEQVGDELFKEQQRLDTLRAEDAMNQLRTKQQDLTYGQDGFVNKKGSQALDPKMAEDYHKRLTDSTNAISETLPTDQAKQLFQKRSQIIQTQFNGDIQRHQLQEHDIYAKSVFQGTVDSELNDAAMHWNDPNARSASLVRLNAVIANEGERLGLAPEQIKAHQQKISSSLYQHVIESTMLHDPLGAQKIYNENQDKLDADQKLQIEARLKSTVMPVEAANTANSIMAKYLPKGGGDMTATQVRAHLGDMLKEASAQAEKQHPGEPLYENLIESKIQTYTNRIAAAEMALEQNARNSIMASVMTPDTNGNKPTDINTVLSDPDKNRAWSHMEPPQQLGILGMLEHNAKGINPPETVESARTWHEYRGMAYSDPAGFQKQFKENFDTLYKELPRTEFNELIALSSSVTKDDAKQISKASTVAHINSVTNNLLQEAGLSVPKKDEKRTEVLKAYDQFTSRMLDASQKFVEDNKRRPNDGEIRDMAKQLLVSGYESGTGWFGWGTKKVKAFQALEEGKQFAVSAPDAEVPKIQEAYRKTFGHEPSKQDIDQWYAVRLQQGKK